MSANFRNFVATRSTCQDGLPEVERRCRADGRPGFFFWWLPSAASGPIAISPLDLGHTQANTSRVKFRVLVSSLLLAVASISAVRARPRQAAGPSELPKPAAPLTPEVLEIYKNAHTVIDWTPRQIHDCPILHKLREAGSQDQLPMVLDRVGQTVALLFREFPRIACDEEVVSDATSREHRGTPANARKFRYIAIARSVGNFQGFEEYRTDLKGNPVDAARLGSFFLITSNYISTCLYLSPADERASHFRHFGIQTIRGRTCHVVGFAQDPERMRRFNTFQVQDTKVIVLVQGLAWIDSETFEILRIVTWLLAPRKDIGLTSQGSTVDFYPVQPSGFERVLWLPRDVIVVTYYRGIGYVNKHRYSNFKLFRVDSTIKPAE